jgi:hypothetical protein
MPVPQALVTRYFQLVVARQFTEAERELEKLKQRMQKTEWNRGYFRALYGMYLSRKTNDPYAFFSKMDFSDKPTIHAYRREFLDHTRNGLHGDFDRGYFSAWADCMRTIGRMEISPSQNQKTETASEPEPQAHTKEHIETLKTDKSQATIANFLNGKINGEDQGIQETENE